MNVRLLVLFQVLKESFHPQAAPRVRMWLNEAEEDGMWLLHTVLFITAPFNNMRTLKFEAQPTNGFFAAVNQVFGGSS